MKTLHVTIRLGVGPDDDGAFDAFKPADIWQALCKAFPFCRGGAIQVEAVNLVDVVRDENADKMAALSPWPHYTDLPFEIVVETVDPHGRVIHRELVGRSNVRSEAEIRRASAQRAIVNPRTHRAVLDVLEGS